jgi:clorobiocin biosynthesis protein CloN5
MSDDEVATALTEFIRHNLVKDMPDDIDEDTPLLERGILDSLKTAMLLNYIRDGLGTAVPPLLIDAKNFHSARTIAVMIGGLSASRT